jgi:hypothetical protein
MKTNYKAKPEEMKLHTKKDKKARKCQKEKKWRKPAIHRGHDDSHRTTMGNLAPKADC